MKELQEKIKQDSDEIIKTCKSLIGDVEFFLSKYQYQIYQSATGEKLDNLINIFETSEAWQISIITDDMCSMIEAFEQKAEVKK